jgi:hypothetical protein
VVPIKATDVVKIRTLWPPAKWSRASPRGAGRVPVERGESPRSVASPRGAGRVPAVRGKSPRSGTSLRQRPKGWRGEGHRGPQRFTRELWKLWGGREGSQVAAGAYNSYNVSRLGVGRMRELPYTMGRAPLRGDAPRCAEMHPAPRGCTPLRGDAHRSAGTPPAPQGRSTGTRPAPRGRALLRGDAPRSAGTRPAPE